ncbi:MAG: c-type cytochrome [Candidatus Eisenbacteria bacterium]|nr:c-type cytochrome [Candidatus Eisenbacteria bacterium]
MNEKDGSRISQATRREAERRDRRVKLALLSMSVLTIALLGAAALRENVWNPWRHYQREYQRILSAKATDDRGRKIANDFHVEMRQVVLPEIGTIDRCVSCHNGVDDPRMTDVANPHRVHPGAYLQWHDPNRFGCTICHRGQGRAMSFEDAKAEDRHWDYPLLPLELTQSSCGVCHAAREVAENGGETYAAGAALFEAKGCRSCHKLGGRGGSLGPALDNEGLKVRGNLPMAGIQGPHTVPEWLIEHFADPQAVVAGSQMPCPGLSRGETEALTTFLLAQQQRDLPGSYLTPEKHLMIYASANPAPMTGADLYNRFCSTCHDTGELGRYDKFFRSFIPAVRAESFKAAASPAYVAAMIRSGRRGTIMPAWGLAAGGMSEEDIRQIVSFVLGREVAGEEIRPAASEAGGSEIPMKATAGPIGDPGRGRSLFVKNCAGCHGPAGRGGVAPTLDSPAFQAYASDAFLIETITQGRRNTAMPAWGARGALSPADIRDVVSYVRTLGIAAGGAPATAKAEATAEATATTTQAAAQ